MNILELCGQFLEWFYPDPPGSEVGSPGAPSFYAWLGWFVYWLGYVSYYWDDISENERTGTIFLVGGLVGILFGIGFPVIVIVAIPILIGWGFHAVMRRLGSSAKVKREKRERERREVEEELRKIGL